VKFVVVVVVVVNIYFIKNDNYFFYKKVCKFPFKRNLFILEENCVFWSDCIELFTKRQKTSICEIVRANIY
jgi:hypothetical protein